MIEVLFVIVCATTVSTLPVDVPCEEGQYVNALGRCASCETCKETSLSDTPPGCAACPDSHLVTSDSDDVSQPGCREGFFFQHHTKQCQPCVICKRITDEGRRNRSGCLQCEKADSHHVTSDSSDVSQTDCREGFFFEHNTKQCQPCVICKRIKDEGRRNRSGCLQCEKADSHLITPDSSDVSQPGCGEGYFFQHHTKQCQPCVICKRIKDESKRNRSGCLQCVKGKPVRTTPFGNQPTTVPSTILSTDREKDPDDNTVIDPKDVNFQALNFYEHIARAEFWLVLAFGIMIVVLVVALVSVIKVYRHQDIPVAVDANQYQSVTTTPHEEDELPGKAPDDCSIMETTV